MFGKKKKKRISKVLPTINVVFSFANQDAFAIASYMAAFATISVGALQALLVM